MPSHSSKTFCLMSLLPPLLQYQHTDYQQHYDLLRNATEFFQCFSSPTTVITDEVWALRAFWAPAAGAGKLWSANICNQQLTSHCHLPAWTMKHSFLCPAPHFEGKRRPPKAVGPPEPIHCLQLLDLLSAQVKEAK